MVQLRIHSSPSKAHWADILEFLPMESCIFFLLYLHTVYYIVCWIISMFFFTCKYVYSKYYMWYLGTSGRSTQLQQNPMFRYLRPWTRQDRGKKVAWWETLAVFIQEVVVHYDICCWELSRAICCLGRNS